ncbi:MAG: type II secretion system F family protein [Deltaproteobacteria bacterium]|nr:type II secretion system F family protein [Deltaproteobacteria bacterium]
MPNFRYSGRAVDGHLLEGEQVAPSAEALAGQLQAGGIVPLVIEEAGKQVESLGQKNLSDILPRRVKKEELIFFCSQMYSLTKAGIPLIRALNGLSSTTRNPLIADTLHAMIESLESGRGLADAMSLHPKVFPQILISMVRVGENSGQTPLAFLQVSRYLEQEKETADQMKAALRYPLAVVVAIFFAIGILSVLVIPTFKKVFEQFNAELPLATRIIIGTSDFIVNYWYFMVFLMVTAVVAWLRYLQTETGRLNWDKHKLRFPLIGSILLRCALIRFARAFSMGFKSGIPVIQTLALTAGAVGNAFVGSRLSFVRNGIERGETLTNSALGSDLFTPVVLQMMAVGEETGELDTMLEDVAEFYEREVAYDLKRLTGAIEPILILFLGVLVLIMALGVFLPIWNLYSVVKG